MTPFFIIIVKKLKLCGEVLRKKLEEDVCEICGMSVLIRVDIMYFFFCFFAFVFLL
jgi:hypothetical protein